MANYKRSPEGEEVGRHVEGRMPSLLLECLGLYLHVGVIIHYKPGIIFAHLCFAARENRNQGLQCLALREKAIQRVKHLGSTKCGQRDDPWVPNSPQENQSPFFSSKIGYNFLKF